MQPMYVVDAFTSEKFSGNPAAVCPLNLEINEKLQQNIAMEMNLSETAFIIPRDGDFVSGRCFGLRWFTPTQEVSLCGHATLAASKVLFDVLGNKNDSIEFHSMSGSLHCKKLSNGKLQLDFPGYEISSINRSLVDKIVAIAARGLPVKEIAIASVPKKLLIVLEDSVTRQQLEQLQPKPAEMHACDPNSNHVKGVMLTVRGSKENQCVDRDGRVYDFCSRYFAPWVGIPEDPVTGSAHCALGPYWSKQLGKTDLYARQCSERSGEVSITVRPDGRVNLSGNAIVMLRGEIDI